MSKDGSRDPALNPPALQTDDWEASAGVSIAAPARRRLLPLILFFAALAVVGYFIFTAMNIVVNTNALDDRVVVLRGEIDDFRWNADQLEAIVSFLDSDEYVERVAREELGLVRVGEEAFALEAPLRPGLEILRSPWWANLLPRSSGNALSGDLSLAFQASSLDQRQRSD